MQQNWNSMLENVAQANEKAVTTATEFNRIATRTQGLLARRQLVVFENCLDAGTRHFEVAISTQDPREAVKRHAEVAVDLGEKLVAATQESLEIQAQARDEFARCIEEGFVAVQTPAEAAVKPAATRKPARSAARKTA